MQRMIVAATEDRNVDLVSSGREELVGMTGVKIYETVLPLPSSAPPDVQALFDELVSLAADGLLARNGWDINTVNATWWTQPAAD